MDTNKHKWLVMVRSSAFTRFGLKVLSGAITDRLKAELQTDSCPFVFIRGWFIPESPRESSRASISRAAVLVECPAQWLRMHDAVLQPLQDEIGRRCYTDQHIEAARALRQRAAPRAAA